MTARIQYIDATGNERYGERPPWYRGLDATRYDQECAAWLREQREQHRDNISMLKLLKEIGIPQYMNWFKRIEDPEVLARTLRFRL